MSTTRCLQGAKSRLRKAEQALDSVLDDCLRLRPADRENEECSSNSSFPVDFQDDYIDSDVASSSDGENACWAGVVVQGNDPSGRVKEGDLVLVPSTDYRDIRKAAFQEYAVTTSCNAARIP